MQTDLLRRSLESLENALPLLQSWHLRDSERGWRNLVHLAASVGIEPLQALCSQLGRLLPRCPDPDMALNNLERFLSTPEGAARFPELLESRARTLATLVQLFANSQFFSDLLAADPDALDMLAVPLRRTPSGSELEDQLRREVEAAFEPSAVMMALRRFRRRQILRIGVNDIIRERPLEEVTRDISRVADAALQVALEVGTRRVEERFGMPSTAAGAPARCVVLAFGKLGGSELNYSSDIDLMVVYDEEGSTRGQRAQGLGNDEFYSRVTGEVVRLLSAHTDHGQAYRVDLRLRPEGRRGPLARSLASTLSYYDNLGRTWERQALIKLRSVAGDRALGKEFIGAVEPFVYRKYLSFAEINDIKALKRRVEAHSGLLGPGEADVKTGHGGIRDVEFTVQFLQLLNGGELPEVRERNTLLALEALQRAGCLTPQERHLLDDSYRFLRRTEHRLQLLFDQQTHRLPGAEDELRKLALRMGYALLPGRAGGTGADAEPLAAFLRDYREKTKLNRKILDHLLHQTFPDEGEQAKPESDLLLDPDPSQETVHAVLGRYPFQDVTAAYQNLNLLAQESVPFLSARRCRHFLASIAPTLLQVVSETPDPDLALLNLERVTASLGAKAVLWELFNYNPPSLRLYVDLCARSPFLSEILTHNPGMIDELLDSLVLNRPRSLAELCTELAELCRGATDPKLILHSFQQKEMLRIGVRDILGKDTVQQTTAALSDVAEAILAQLTRTQDGALRVRLGEPRLAQGERPCRHALIGLGKLGGQEMAYHSDLDVILVYEGDGQTSADSAAGPTDNFHYFTELAQRIIRTAGESGPLGRLYQVDMRLRPTGRSGSLVVPLAEFRRYYRRDAALWERQALTRGRVVYGDPAFARLAAEALAAAAYGRAWRPADAEEILAMRRRLEAGSSGRDLKRGFGGLVDIEFLVQLFQLKYAEHLLSLRVSNTWEALDALLVADLLTPDAHRSLREGYEFLRLIEARLRIFHNRSLDEIPEDPAALDKLARHLGMDDAGNHPGNQLLGRLDHHTRRVRMLFLHFLERERGPDLYSSSACSPQGT